MDPAILEPIPGANPSGANLRKDMTYRELETRVKHARGEIIADSADPDVKSADENWGWVVGACRALLGWHSKDLMIAAWLVEAQFAVYGFPGLRDAFDILRGLTEGFWDTLYPEISDVAARKSTFDLLSITIADALRSVKLEDKAPNSASRAFRPPAEQLDECIHSVEELALVCQNKFGESRPTFKELRQRLNNLRWKARDNCLRDLPQESETRRDSRPGSGMVAAKPPSDTSDSREPFIGIGFAASSRVMFTLIAPEGVAPGVPFEVFVWAHNDGELSIIRAKTAAELRDKTPIIRSKGPFRIPGGTTLTVRLRVLGAVIDEPEDTMIWLGKRTRTAFVVTLPELNSQTNCHGVAHIYAEGVQVAKIPFLLPASSDRRLRTAPAVHFRTAFASYASDDRDAVLGRIQGIKKIAPDMDVFLDVVSLRSGQNWEQELWRVIPASDIFYLFWSAHARRSEWVEKEWRCALRERGIGFIDPIPLQSPEESPPPPELGSLHFNDWMLAFRRSNPAAPPTAATA
jgi:ImpA, N-terminal, type VI secretion system/TIR domain